MSDLEEQLQQWALQQRAAAGPVPVGLARRGGRRWLPLVAAAAAALVVGGSAAVVSSGIPTRVARPVATPGPAVMPAPAATNAAGVIPWADLPAADTTHSQPPLTAAAAMARICRPSDLAATAEQAERGGGRTFRC